MRVASCSIFVQASSYSLQKGHSEEHASSAWCLHRVRQGLSTGRSWCTPGWCTPSWCTLVPAGQYLSLRSGQPNLMHRPSMPALPRDTASPSRAPPPLSTTQTSRCSGGRGASPSGAGLAGGAISFSRLPARLLHLLLCTCPTTHRRQFGRCNRPMLCMLAPC